MPMLIGNGNDLHPVITDVYENDHARGRDYREEYRQQQGREYDSPYDDESFGGSYSGGGYSSSDDGRSNRTTSADGDGNEYKIYERYKQMDAFTAGQLQRLGNDLVNKSGIKGVDIVRTTNMINTAVQASGIITYQRYKAMSQNLQNTLSGYEGMYMARTLTDLQRKGKITYGQFEMNAKGLRDLKKEVDKEFLDRTGIDVSKFGEKQLKDMLDAYYKTKPEETITQLGNITLKRPTKINAEAIEFAETSLSLNRHLGMVSKFDKAKSKQKVSVESLVDRLCGDDVALWDGYQYASRSYRSVKRTYKTFKKIKGMLSSETVNTAYGAAREAADATTQATEKAVQKVASKNRKVTKSMRANRKLRGTKKVAQIAARNVGRLGAAQGAAAGSGAAAGGGAAAGSAAGGAAGGTAAGGASAAASGAGAAGGVAGGVVGAIVIIIAVIILIIIIIIGVAISAFHGDKELSGDETPNGEAYESMLYKAYEILDQHDKDLLQQIEDGFSQKEVKKNAINKNVYSAYSKASFVRQLTGDDEIQILPAKNPDGTSVAQGYNGFGVPMAFIKSNAKDILIAGTVMTGNMVEDTPRTFKRYIEGLWYETHDVSAEFIVNADGTLFLEPCEGGCSEWFCVKSVTTSRTVTYVDEETGETKTKTIKTTKYYLADKATKTSIASIESARSNIAKYQNAGELWMYTEGDLMRFCPGHANYKVSVTTHYLNDNPSNPLESSLFDADNFSNIPQNAQFWNTGSMSNFLGGVKTFFKTLDVLGISGTYTKLTSSHAWSGEEFLTFSAGMTGHDEYIAWDGWTLDNKEMALQMYDDDWKDLYGIDFSMSELGGTPLGDSEIQDLTGTIDDETMQALLSFAISCQGRIPYYWGGKQEIRALYSEHSNMTISEFLSTYYPHIGTEPQRTSGGYPVSINGWSGTVDPDHPLIGLDCAGFVDFVYNSFGINVGTKSSTWDLERISTEVSRNNLRPGDLLINNSDPDTAHVVMFIQWNDKEQGTYTTVECTWSSGVKVVANRSDVWEYYGRIVN